MAEAGSANGDGPDWSQLSPDRIEATAAAIASHLQPIRAQLSRALSQQLHTGVFLKYEGLQPIRSFKLRGALAKVLGMSASARSAGLVAASTGNHGLGTAYAASVFGLAATIYAPERANEMKIAAIRRLGATVVESGQGYQEAFAQALSQLGPRTLVHAFDDIDVVAGQGTLGVELLRELPDLDTVLIPVGGGGLACGIAAYLKQRRPAIRVLGVEPEGADAMHRSISAGRVVELEEVRTIADGLAARRPGAITFELATRYLDDVLVVTDWELMSAIRAAFELEHLLLEPSGAAGLAALLHHYRPGPGEQVAVVLSGANVTTEVLVASLTS